jgi:RimJ/RimL family protein N-acetyltransferase
MVAGPEIRTERLVLRRWEAKDRPAFAALNADPDVMAFFPTTLGRQASDAAIDGYEADFRDDGFGYWAVIHRESDEFLGMAGLGHILFTAHFTPAVEVGWRFRRNVWGHGYATEAGRAALAFGHRDIGLAEIVAVTSAANERSQLVMQRLGMVRNEDDDFDRPGLEAEPQLRRNVLYRSRAIDAGWSLAE